MKPRTRWLALIGTVALGGSLLVAGPVSAVPPPVPAIGMICTPGSVAGPIHTFNLVANTGYIDTPDGNSVFMWSYANADAPENGHFQTPGPILCVTEGETVVVTLHNTLAEPTSIVFPGQENVTAVGGAAGLLTSEASTGTDVTYTFSAGSPGTYAYESGSDISKQLEMGLYGALIVRPSIGSDYAYDIATQFDPSREYLLLLNELDPDLHHAVEVGGTYDFNALRNRYFAINGREFPDTLQDNGTSLLPNQPYGALVRVQPYDATLNNRPALIRMINVGELNHPYHPHGNHMSQIAQDGRQLLSPGGASASSERFGETIGSGQTQDYLLSWNDQDHWNPNTNKLPVAQPNYRNLFFKDGNTHYSGSPYLGYKGTLPTGTVQQNVCGEWYFPWHSHALNEFANFDEGFGGMATLLRVDPLGGCFAFPTASKILAGTLNGGSATNLAVDDASYYKVNSTTTGTRTTDWYGQFGAVPPGAANLKVTYKGNGSMAAYLQNFDTLATSGTSSTLPTGWALAETGTGANTTYGTGTGSSSTANTYSFGASGGTDRAFGGLRGTGATALVPTVGTHFTNNTGGTVTSLTVGYTGEQWRYGGGGASGADRLDFQFSTDAASLSTGTWTDVNTLDFNSPITTGTARALNGNTSANRTVLSQTITGLSLAPGASYWLRWADFDRGGSAVADDGLGVDAVSVTPVGPTQATTVSIWNWTTSLWVPLAGPTEVGPTDVTVANDTAAPGSSASYIGTGTNKGLVRVRVLSTEGGGGTASFVTGGNFMKLVYDAP